MPLMLAVPLAAAHFALSSPAIPNGGTIPRRYTCDGAGTSPPLRWTAPPAPTVRLRLTVVDPDAPGGHFVHWQATRIPARAGSVATVRPSAGRGHEQRRHARLDAAVPAERDAPLRVHAERAQRARARARGGDVRRAVRAGVIQPAKAPSSMRTLSEPNAVLRPS